MNDELNINIEPSQKLPLKKLIITSAVVIGAMILVSLFASAGLPTNQKFPIHWGADGKPNGFGNKYVAFYSIPATTVFVVFLLAIVPRIEPRKSNLERSVKPYVALWMGVLGIMVLTHIFVVAASKGHLVNIANIVPLAVGILLMVIGNYLGKIQSNFMFGIRTPWTLSSELSWNKTHRLGGKLFFLFGAIVTLTSFYSPARLLFGSMISTGTIFLVVILFIYSYFVWKNDPSRK